MEKNLAKAAAYCAMHALAWRPHAKTHKSPWIARAQVALGAAGVTVATIREAEEMATAVDDLLLAYPVLSPAAARRLMAVPARLAVVLDSSEALRIIASAAAEAGRVVDILIEVDVGMRRVGISDTLPLVELAREAATTNGVRFGGIAFYPGHIRAAVDAQSELLASLSGALDGFVDALDTAGFRPRTVSGGSTPTLWRTHELRHVTELRAGTSVFNDRTTAVIGACAWEDCAYSVLATVVSTSMSGQAVIDAGSKAIAKEELRGPAGGYGALLDRPEVVVSNVSEEHGILDLSATAWRPRIGDRVRVVPNHVCVSVNLHERIYAVRNAAPVGSWGVAARGRGPRTGGVVTA